MLRLNHRVLPLALLAVVLFLTTGCATTRPGTGDISFRLLWDGSADLDLHVTDPVGRHVGTEMSIAGGSYEEIVQRIAEFRRLEEEHGAVPKGVLDIDCNADPERMCKRPIENVFWPAGTAPRGEYEVWVQHFQNVTGDGAVPFVLEIRRGERVVQTVRGTVDRDDPTSETVSVVF